MYQHILVITDQDNVFTFALDKANEVAKQYDAVVEVVSFVDIANVEINITDYTKKVNAKIHRCFDSDVTVHTHVADTDNITQWINRYCENHAVDLVIKTGHRTETLFYTPTDWHLIRQLKCSLLLVSDRKWRAKSRVLVAVDAGSKKPAQLEMDQKVIKEAHCWAEAKDMELHVTYSAPLPTVAIEFGTIEAEQYEREHSATVKDQLNTVIEQTDISNIEGHYSFGPAEKRIPSTANRIKADLVVVGSIGRTGVKAALLGNTAEKILHHLRTDILVVKPYLAQR